MIDSKKIVKETEMVVQAQKKDDVISELRGRERSEQPRNGEVTSSWQNKSQQNTITKTKSEKVKSKTSATIKPEPEVLEKPARRKFTTQYKQRILEEADACNKQGQIGAMLRREGLFSSHICNWRRERKKAMHKFGNKKRGRKPTKNPLSEENAKLARENVRLKRDLEKAKLVIDIQKKTSQLLGITLTDTSEYEKTINSEGSD